MLKRLGKVFIVLTLALLGIRAALPEFIKYGVNRYLANDIENYQGSIEDFDLSLYRGAFQVQFLRLWKKDRTALPLLQVEEIDWSISWKQLFKGQILGDIHIQQPRVNFIDSKTPERKQLGLDLKIRKIFKDLMPIEVNSLVINDGIVHIVNYDLKVPAEFNITKVNLEAHDIKSKNADELLPGRLKLTGVLQSDAPFELKGKIGMLAAKPSFDVDFKIEHFDLKKLNKILAAYGPLTFTKGEVSIYSEAAAKHGQLIAYVKPFLEDVDVVRKEEKFFNFKHLGLELISAGGNLVFKNKKNETAATRIEIRGPLKKPKLDADKALSYTIDNAFGKPLKAGLENSIDITQL